MTRTTYEKMRNETLKNEGKVADFFVEFERDNENKLNKIGRLMIGAENPLNPEDMVVYEEQIDELYGELIQMWKRYVQVEITELADVVYTTSAWGDISKQQWQLAMLREYYANFKV